MTRGRGTASIVASPVLVGAVTTLIVIVSVFLAYNANKGLPFVPTYDVSATLPHTANLVESNEVRVGGFRVGIIDKVRPGTGVVNGRSRAVAIVDMKLDKTVDPLARDTRILVRARSALGLKYIELQPGKSQESFKAGDTIPLRQAGQTVEFDDFLNTFDPETRQYSQEALTGYVNAFAGRGQDINEAIEGLAPFFRYLEPVMRNLSDPRTNLDEFFRSIGRASRQVAPVARTQAILFRNMADTFEAIGRCPDCLRATIEKSPPTMDTAIRSFRVQRPFLAEFAQLSRELMPTARILPTALPRVNRALREGTITLPQTVELNENTQEVFQALDDLASEPTTFLALRDLRTTLSVTAPLLNFIAPYQTVCNYTTYFLTGLSGHIGAPASNGTSERVLVKEANQQDNAWSDFADRGVDIPAGIDPTGAKDAEGRPQMAQHTQPYAPAIDARGNADCTVGQWGYIDGPLNTEGRYGPAPPGPNFANQAGGSHTVNAQNTPGLHGTTFDGVPRLQDVP